MKILWFSHRDITHTNAGGAERTIYEISKRLVRNGDRVVWISVSDNRIKQNDLIDGINIRRFSGNVSVHLKVHSIIKDVIPDVIIDDLGHAVPWGSERLTEIPGTVFFRHLHRRSLKGQVSFPLRISFTEMEKLYPILYKRWTFVTESESSIGDLQLLHINRNRIVKIPPGVDFNLFKPIIKTTEPTIVYFGGFRDYKRPGESLYVLKEVLKENNAVTLKVIGSGPSLNQTKLISQKLGIEKNVEFLERMDTAKLAEIVGSSWVNIHSSITEGFGYSILESSAAGTPTVAYNVQGVKDVIKNNINGFLVNDGNRADMVAKVMEIINSRDSMSKSSVVEARNYSWEKTTDEWHNHLLRIIKGTLK